MAYAAVCCLELTIERLLNSFHISIVQNSSPQIIKLMYEEILSLKEALSEFDKRRSTINMKMVKTLEVEIIDAIYQIEDAIDPHLSNQFQYSQSEEENDHRPLMLFSVYLQEIKQDVDFFIETIKKMKRAYIHELRNPSPEEVEEEEENNVVPSIIDFDANESNMVGLSDLFMRIKDRLIHSPQSEWMAVSLYGMAGIGKTTIAKKLFQDPFIASRYSRHVFVTIGPKYQLVGILVDILTQLKADIDEVLLMEREEFLVRLKEMVYESLNYLRYLIVLDDVWDIEFCCELAKLFPDDENGSRVLVTTRLREVAECADYMSTFRIPFLTKKESWDLLRHKVFHEVPCPCELEKSGKKIAENCEGLPLTIVTVADILLKANMTTEYWNEVAANKRHTIFANAYDRMSKVLYPSYDYLDQHLKACFLYCGAFPQNYLLFEFQVISLWSAEGFLDRDPTDNYGYFHDLNSRNVIMFDIEVSAGYHLHSSFWYLCSKEVAKTKFFYAFNSLADALANKGLHYEHRLCIRNNVLLAVEDVQNSIASTSKVRSLLCTGPSLKYPVPLCLENLRLLRVLDALKIRLYEFPLEVVKLVQLRYLALLYNGNLPPSISKLWNLQHLIVHRYSIVKSVGNLSYLPIEIWNMKELKFLQTIGRDLPHPCREASLLPNLLALTGVGPHSCSKDVLEKIPNLKVLLISIELVPDSTQLLSFFDHIFHLHQLDILTCEIKNPILKAEVVTPLAPLSNFPATLTSLTLTGSFGYQWEEISKISSLPNLRLLRLKCYAFRGPKWVVRDDEFQRLEVIVIEDTDLEQWAFQNSSCLPAIRVLRIKHCYKLKKIPLTFGTSLEIIEVLDCNPMVVDWANKLTQDWGDKYGDHKRSVVLTIHSSWDDGDIQS